MPASSSNIFRLTDGGLNDGTGGLYLHRSTETSTQILSAGFFAGMGVGSRGDVNVGLQIGDIILHRASTNAAIPGRVTLHSVISATANVASTIASSGFNAGFDCSVASAT